MNARFHKLLLILCLSLNAFSIPSMSSAAVQQTSAEVLSLNDQALADMARGDLESAMDKLNQALKIDSTYGGTIENWRKCLQQMNALMPSAQRRLDQALNEIMLSLGKTAPQMTRINNIANSALSNQEKGREILSQAQEIATAFEAEERALLDARNILEETKGRISDAQYREYAASLAQCSEMHLKKKLANYLMLAFCYEVHGAVDNAIQQVTWYMSAKPQEADRYEHRAYLYYKLGDYSNALADAQTAMRLDGSFSVKCLQRIAAIHVARKEFDQAIKALDEALAVPGEGQRANLLSNKAAVYAIKGDAQSAVNFIGQARNETRGKPDPFFEAQVSCLAEDDPASALALVSQQIPERNLGALKIGDLLALRAFCFAKLKNVKRANDDMANYASLNAQNAQALEQIEATRQVLGGQTTVPAPQKLALDRPVAKKWALVVGIGNYVDQSIPRLKYSAKDAKDFADHLTNVAHWPADHVKLLLNEKATRENVLDLLGDSWMPKVVGPDDLVVIYLSTHGTPANRDVGALNYIVAFNTQKQRLFSTGIPMQDICQLICKRLKADRIFLVLDCCYSGASALVAGTPGSSNISAQRIFVGGNQYVLCSSGVDQRSWESQRYPNGVFTRKMLDSLTSKDLMDFEQLFVRVRDQVKQEVSADDQVLQVPQRAGNWTSRQVYSHFRPKLTVLNAR